MTDPDSPGRWRRLLTLVLALGLSGSLADLVLLRHYEDVNQLIPLSLILMAFVVLAWHALAASRTSVRAVQFTMALFVVAGLVGVNLHLQSSLEFQREIDPSLQGASLLLKALQAKAPPALAPGVMVQLGLLGLVLTYRHPALARPSGKSKTQDKEE
jgi:hypothetical protein